MIAGHLQIKNDYYYMVLSYLDANGKRKQPWFPTGLPIKNNKKRAEKMLLELRQTYVPPAEHKSNGELSADMLKAVGCEYVIVGHSERRKYHPEDDANIVDQVRAVLAAGMLPILCVGESFEERRQGIELDFAVGQVRDVTRDLNEEQAAKLIVAYEPVWAIGTGMVATPQSAQDAANAIRNDLKTTFGTKVSDSVRILYGGSVTSKNAAELISQPDVDGFLIGGAALDVEELAKIARLALKSTKSRN